MKTKITEQDYIKANRKASREEEIRLYGKPISLRRNIHKSKKQYNRQRDRKIPYFFCYISLKILIYLLYIIIKKEQMGLPQILTDKEVLGSHIQEVRKMGERARMEGKVYELCTEDDHLDEYVEAFCIYSPFVNNTLRNILYSAWWEGYKN